MVPSSASVAVPLKVTASPTVDEEPLAGAVMVTVGAVFPGTQGDVPVTTTSSTNQPVKLLATPSPLSKRKTTWIGWPAKAAKEMAPLLTHAAVEPVDESRAKTVVAPLAVTMSTSVLSKAPAKLSTTR